MRSPLLASAGALSLVALAAVLPGVGSAAASPGGGSAFSQTKTITRAHLENGKNVVVDKRTVTVKVDHTTNLRDRQEINVQWSGAHPTGGIVADQNSGDAKQEEYPVVLLECRGLDSSKLPASKRLSPQTCWTQTSAERFQDSFDTAFPPYRIDRYAPKSQRKAVVGQPKKRPAACFTASPAEHWVPFDAVSGHVFYGGSGGCAGMAPEAANVGGLSLPSNTTYGVTERDGTGSAEFNVWTSESNASLGCSDTVACSLVVVPIMGISCDVAATSLPPADRPPVGTVADDAAQKCEATGKFAPGELVQPRGGEDVSVSGTLWWSASNWRNRISVPLHFAPLSNVCDLLSTDKGGIDIYGSESLAEATAQWSPKFCLNPKLFRFKHVLTGEPEARNVLKVGNVVAAFDSGPQPGGYGKPVVNAPTAVSGFTIAYTIDDGQGRQYTKLRLTPRLLAKLLTESYPAINPIKEEYPALADNPLNITLDPEFQALNPTITKGVPATQSAAELFALSSDSDVMYALTSYINADPEARAWLNGKPDPWGMVVNPNYKNISLPTDSWPLLDTFEPPKMYASGTNDCLYNQPVPYLPLVAAPVARMSTITLALQYGLSNSTTVCQQLAEGVSEGEKLVTMGRQTAGFRFMIGVTSLGDAHRYNLRMASLQTAVSSKASPTFASDAGRTFVAPTDASLKAAAQAMVPDASTGTWSFPYQKVATSPAMADAYPGTMLIYTSVPTTGLTKQTAQQLATFLRFVAGPGQEPGFGVGQLPPGYLPMTKANGLGGLSTYGLLAANAVVLQRGETPAPVAPGAWQDVPPAGGGGSNPPPGGGSSTPPSSGGSSTPPPSGGTSPTPGPSTSPSPTVVAATGFTAALRTGLGMAAIPAIAVVAIIAGLTAAFPRLADEARGVRGRTATEWGRLRRNLRTRLRWPR